MSSKDYILGLKKIVHEELEKTYIELIDGYINNVRSILFFIGKSILCIKHLRDNTPSIIHEVDLKLIEKTYDRLFYYTYCHEEKLFANNEVLTRDFKSKIISKLIDISDDEIKDFSLGQIYEAFITNKQKKSLGQVYTPGYIVKHMVSLGITDDTILNNPYLRIVDPACGGGYFLIGAYERLKSIFEKNYSSIIAGHPEIKDEIGNNIHSFIIRNNLHGYDIDDFAVYMTKISLTLKGDLKDNIQPNVFKRDILLEQNKDLVDIIQEKASRDESIGKFDLVIGNPPYIGHKSVDKDYRKKLKDYYYDVYSDKADVSYCFFKKAYELLEKQGKLLFITSRYFIEAPSAVGLRSFIKKYYYINRIIDFYGQNIFKGVGISPVIVECTKDHGINNRIIINRFKNDSLSRKMVLDFSYDFDEYYVGQNELKESGWLLVSKEERELFYKIHSQGLYSLDLICECNQGIITGYDKAFIVDMDIIEKNNLESKLLKPWIKNSEVRKYRGINNKRYILYTDLIEEPDNYRNAISHIKPFKERLESRRECVKGIREWYQLQWGRDLSIFNKPRIFFPFKASSNEFTIVYEEACCSADVYILSVKDNYNDEISIEYLAAFLNSLIFEFYFKSVGKKLNENMYEYYPNKLMSLRIKLGSNRDVIEEKVKKIMDYYNILQQLDDFRGEELPGEDIEKLNKEINKEISYIDSYFFSLYELSLYEIRTIEKAFKDQN